jgi:hypothetical protein
VRSRKSPHPTPKAYVFSVVGRRCRDALISLPASEATRAAPMGPKHRFARFGRDLGIAATMPYRAKRIPETFRSCSTQPTSLLSSRQSKIK